MDVLAAFGPSGAAVAIVFLFIKYFAPVIINLTQTIEQNTKVTNESYQYLKNLNGELRKATKKKLGK